MANNVLPLTYATEADVRQVLGALPLPTGIDIAVHITRAHAVVVAHLIDVYSENVPTFTGPALRVVADAEASLAAAGVLSALLVRQENPDYTAVNNWRSDAKATLSGPIPGFPVGAVDPDGSGPKVRVVPAAVKVTSRGPYTDEDGTFYVTRTGQVVATLWG